MSTLIIQLKGLADIIVAAILAVNPNIIYNSFISRAISNLTGLHISNPDSAPGFNHAIASMVAAVGIAHIVAARSGPAAHPPIRRFLGSHHHYSSLTLLSLVAMSASWAFFNLATCASPHARAANLASVTQLFTGISHSIFAIVLYFSDTRSKRN